MEHRWGNRSAVDVAVEISGRPGPTGLGRITNLSVSGAWIRSRLTVPVLGRVMITLSATPRRRPEEFTIGAYVTRATRDGFGIEWYELDPPCLRELLQPHLHTLSAAGHTAPDAGSG